MTRPGSLTDLKVRHLIRVGGLNPKDIQIIAIGFPTALLTTLERGQIDGFAISPPTDLIAIDRGKAVMWVNNAAGADPSIDLFMMESLLTIEGFAKANPEIVRKMIRATKRAVGGHPC
jgi:ABC-type nitrate/sulfonate/bicarbonate transport system substrate-binding protein